MKALITDGRGKIYLENIAIPEISEYDCLVKMKSCLFCNTTDRHIVDGSFNFGLKYPAVLGHESIGQVVKTGSRVCNFSTGDIVSRSYAVYPNMVTAEGLGSAWGGFAEYGMIRDYRAMLTDNKIKIEKVPSFFLYMQKIPDEIDWEKAMMISCQKEVLSSTELIAASGKKVLIVGAGVAGCLFADFIKFRGAAKVVVAARNSGQLEFVSKNTLADQVLPFSELSGHFDCIVDTSGSLDLLKTLSAKYLSTDGMIYSYAIYSNMKDDFFAQNRTRFQRIDPREYLVHEDVSEMVAAGKIDCTPYITHRYNIEEFKQAWDSVRSKKTIKTAILF